MVLPSMLAYRQKIPAHIKRRPVKQNRMCACEIVCVCLLFCPTSQVNTRLSRVITEMTMFMVLLSWQSHRESSPGSLHECRASAQWPPTLKPSQPTWAVTLPVGRYHPHPPSLFITFRVRHSRGEMYIGHGRLSVCLSVCPSPHSNTTARTQMTDVTWGKW